MHLHLLLVGFDMDNHDFSVIPAHLKCKLQSATEHVAYASNRSISSEQTVQMIAILTETADRSPS